MTDLSPRSYHYLALGDSYTIGESVPSTDNYPNQLTALLRLAGYDFLPPRIVARTGWTTDELEAGIVSANNEQRLYSNYDFVTLLIGVNNQYRGRSLDQYRAEFEELLKKAVRYADNRPQRVAVLSIPDWGVTPFASGRDRAQIAREIDAFNAANREISERYNIYYIDVTPWTREAAADPTLLSIDGLHPSAKEYRRWAERLYTFFRSRL